MLLWQLKYGTLCDGGGVTPAFKTAIAKIEEERKQIHFSALSPFQKEDRLADLMQKAEIYSLIAYSNDKCVSAAMTDQEVELFLGSNHLSGDFLAEIEADKKELDAKAKKTIDALYAYTREKAFSEEGDYILPSDTNILEMDPFDEARYIQFSSHRWWRDSSNDSSTELCGFENNHGLFPASSHLVVIDDFTTAIQRWEVVLDGVRAQRFGPDIFTDLVAVARQWVETREDKDLNLADDLRKKQAWQDLVSFGKESWPHQNAMVALSQAGLPYTPSVQQFLEEESANSSASEDIPSSTIPCRGGMVTTFVLASAPIGVGQIRTISKITPSGGSVWVTDNFFNSARQCLADHAEWAKNLNLGALARATLAGGRNDPEKTDGELEIDQLVAEAAAYEISTGKKSNRTKIIDAMEKQMAERIKTKQRREIQQDRKVLGANVRQKIRRAKKLLQK